MTSVVQVMGWRSQQYGSFERFLVALARRAAEQKVSTTLVFQAPPASTEFISDVSADICVLPAARTPADPRFAGRLARLLRRRGATHVHTHFGADGYAALAVARAVGVRRRFMTKHITPAAGTVSALRHRAMAGQIETVFAVSEQVAGRLRGLGVPSAKVQLCRLGVDASAYHLPAGTRESVRRELGIGESTRLLLSTSHLRPGKGVELLPALAAGMDDVVVVLAGDGPLREALQIQAGQLGLNGRFRLLGVRQDIPRLLTAADVVVFPTTADEGLPLGPLEAVAAAVPLVASAVSDLPALLGDLALLVRPGDAAGLASACRQVLSDLPASRARAAVAAARVASELSVQRAADAYLARYLSPAK